MDYENYLMECRACVPSVAVELAQIAKSVLITNELAASQDLSDWLELHGRTITVITTKAQAIATLSRLKVSVDKIGIDVETAKAAHATEHPQAGLHPLVSRIRLVQLFQGPDSGIFIIDCFAAGYEWMHHLVGGHYVAHNSHFECSHFWQHLKEELAIDCTMLAGRVFHGQNKGLAEFARDYLETHLSKSLQVSDWARQRLLDEQLIYAAADAVVAKLLWQKFETIFAESDTKYRTAYRFLRSLVYPVVRQSGIGFDVDEHAKVITEWQAAEYENRQILATLGLADPASVKQKQQWLNGQLSAEEMMNWPQTNNGNLSTAADVLDQALHVPGAAPLARWSQVSTRLSNFGPKLAAKVIDGCLYPHYRIAGMVTGRFGCSDPNIQNQPRTGFKHLYRAPKGHQFVTGDLSQIELRVAGLISGDDVINDAYARGQDLHREVAAERAGKASADVTKIERQAAKAINFGLIFGAGANTLREQAVGSYGVAMSRDDANEAKAFFHTKYARLTAWQKEVVDDANANGYSESPYIQLTRHYEDRVYTHAMNFPVQSGAWEVLALAILYIDKRLPTDGSIKISHHVYDELCLVAIDAKVMEAALLLRDGFVHGFKTAFPLGATRGLVEIGAGCTWDAASQEVNRIQAASL